MHLIVQDPDAEIVHAIGWTTQGGYKFTTLCGVSALKNKRYHMKIRPQLQVDCMFCAILMEE